MSNEPAQLGEISPCAIGGISVNWNEIFHMKALSMHMKEFHMKCNLAVQYYCTILCLRISYQLNCPLDYIADTGL